MRAKGKCPSCGEKVSPEDFLCPNCELILDASKVPAQAPGLTEVSVVRRMMELPQRGLPTAQPPPKSAPTASSADATRVMALPPEVNGVPIVVASLTRKAMALSELEAWIVSLIDGSSEAPALAKKAGIGELELRVVLHSLHQKMVVDFADEPFRDEPLPPAPPQAPPPLTEDEPLNLPSPSHDADVPSVIVEGTLLADATPPPPPAVVRRAPGPDATPPPTVRGRPEPDATPPPPPVRARQAVPPPEATPPAPPTPPPPPAPEATPPPARGAGGRRAPETRPLPPPPPAAARARPDEEAARATSPRRVPGTPAGASSPSATDRAASEAGARASRGPATSGVTGGAREADEERRALRDSSPAGRSASDEGAHTARGAGATRGAADEAGRAPRGGVPHDARSSRGATPEGARPGGGGVRVADSPGAGPADAPSATLTAAQQAALRGGRAEAPRRSAAPQPSRKPAEPAPTPPPPHEAPTDDHVVEPQPPPLGGEVDGWADAARPPALGDEAPAPPPPPPDALEEEAPAPPPPPPPPPIERTDPRIAFKGRTSQKVLDALKQVKRRDGASEPPPPPRAGPEPSSVNVADVHAEPSLQVALRMEQGGRFNEAIRFLENSIAKSPDAPSLYNRLAIILMRERSDFRRAESLLRKAVELAPENKVYSMNLTQVLSRAAIKSQKR
ncbi:MAG: hypothetical protein AB1938_08665 [Myxococcota bacterium]